MLNKLILAHMITRFYKIFGEELDVVPCRVRPRDFKTEGFLLDVHFDVNEMLKAYEYRFYEEAYELSIWLEKLARRLEHERRITL